MRKIKVIEVLFALALVFLAGSSHFDWGAIRLILYAMFHAVLIILPIGFFMLLALDRGVTNGVIALSVDACASGIFVYAIFWLWMTAPWAGIIFSVVAFVAMGVTYLKKLKGLRHSDVIREWGLMVTLWFCYALFILSYGFAPFGIDNVLANVALRFSHPLPIDNKLPFIFAQQIAGGGVSVPMIGNWLNSDRPPLQTAYFLTTGAVRFRHNDLHYQVCATLLQCLWVIALWAVLRAKQIGRFAMLLALAVPMFSGIAVVHGLFTWPKLLPVFYVLLICGILFDDDTHVAQHWQTGVVVGGLAALAMLCHGGSIFALLGIGLALLLFRRIPNPAFIAATVTAGAVLLLTWTFYQVNIDPPGNRLLKWHLAGVVPIDSRSFGQSLINSYSALTPGAILEFKWANFTRLIDHPLEWGPGLFRASFGLSDIAERQGLRGTLFFTLAASWGVLAFAPLALFVRGRAATTRERSLGCMFLVLSVCIGMFWILLLFGPGTTVIHQGSLVLPMFLFIGSVLVACGFSKLFAGVLTAMHFLIVFALYFRCGWHVDGVLPDLSLYILAAVSLCMTLAAMISGSERIFNNPIG